MKKAQRAKWATLFLIAFTMGQTSDCGPPDPGPSGPNDPLALDCVVGGTQYFLPIDISIDPDRYITAGTGLFVDASVTARVPYDAFCALDQLGYVQAELASASATLEIGGASRPVPPEMTVVANELPLGPLDILGACGGFYGPEIELELGPTTTAPWSDGAWTMDFMISVDGIDVQFENVDQLGFQTIPSMSLLDFCEPTDRSNPPNGTVTDPEDSPRIAADPNRDGIYDVLATAQNQVQLNVNGYCVGKPCDDANSCTIDHCDHRNRGWCTYDQRPDGTQCDIDGAFGTCIAGACVHGSPQQSRTITVACTNNVTADVTILPATLRADPQSVVAGVADDWKLGGITEFSEQFLDIAQGTVPGGVSQVDLVDVNWTVHVRSGATMVDTVLTNKPLPTTCLIGGLYCNPANDGASVPGSQPNTDCVPVGTFNPCQAKAAVPTSADCAVGGTCDILGKLNSQCSMNGFCVTGNLRIPLEDQFVSVTPAGSGSVLIGWDDQGTGATVNPNGTYGLPAAVFTAPLSPLEMRFNASGLSVALVCTMAVDSNGPNGVGVPGQGSPTPDSALISFPISDTSPPCQGIRCEGEGECTASTCNDANGMCFDEPASNGWVCDLGAFDGVCSGGACVSVCDFLPDETPCNFAGADGACSNGLCVDFCQGVPEYTNCDFGGLQGVCSSGACASICSVLPEGTSCEFGPQRYSGACSAGFCVSICDTFNCDDGTECTYDYCEPQDGLCRHDPISTGIACRGGDGTCQSGVCEYFPVSFPAQTKTISVACTDGLSEDVSILPFDLTVHPVPGPIGASALLDGVAHVPESFFDRVVEAATGGVASFGLASLNATVQVRSGALGPDVKLRLDSNQYGCALGALAPQFDVPCDPANDQPSIPGLVGNTDCVPTGSFNACVSVLSELPISTDCRAGGLCEALGKTTQCDTASACAVGGLALPLGASFGHYDATGFAGEVLFGWADTSNLGTNPDGTFIMPTPSSPAAGPVGLRFYLNGGVIGLECLMAVDSGGVEGVGVPGQASLTPDAALIAVALGSDRSSCYGVICPDDENECTDAYCDFSDGSCNASPNYLNGVSCEFGALDGVCADGTCASVCVNLAEGTSCDFGGLEGICSDSTCLHICDAVAEGTPCDFGGLPGTCSGGNCLCVDGTLCDFGGAEGICFAGACVFLCEGVPDGTTCDFGGNPGACSAGACVSACDALDCDDGNWCTDDYCVIADALCRHDPVNTGLACDGGTGVCQAGVCEFFPIDAPPQTKTIEVACRNNLTGELAFSPFELTVDPNPSIPGASVSLDGVAHVDEMLLDLAQAAIPGGGVFAYVVDVKSTVHVRSGAVGPDVVLGLEPLPRECLFGMYDPDLAGPCDPANDLPSIPGNRGNTDCVPTGSFNPCSRIVDLPTSADCTLGGVCDQLGKGPGTYQCDTNGLCITGGLSLPLEEAPGYFSTKGFTGNVLFGWQDDPTKSSAVGSPAIDPDGTWNIPPPTFTGVAGDLGIALNIAGLTLQVECVMGVDSDGPDGVGVPGDASPTPDSSLIAFPIP